MIYVSVKNLEKYHPSYKDRQLSWCKTYFTMLNADPEFELLTEIDKWRLMAFIMIELQLKRPVPVDKDYLIRKGFDLKKRPISLTLQMLHNFLDVCEEPLQNRDTEKRREEKNREEERRGEETEQGSVTEYPAFEKSILTLWNAFTDKYPTLSKVREVSEKRRAGLKKRFERESFRDFMGILEAIRGAPFLLGENQRRWVVSFDWLIENDTNYLKVLEGKYKNTEKNQVSEQDVILAKFGVK